MKKKKVWLAVIFAVLLSFVLVLGACGPTDTPDDDDDDDNPDEPTRYAVTFNLNYPSSTPIVRQVEEDKTANRETPIRTGYNLVNWYTDEACTNLYDFASLVKGPFTLYAKWEVKEYTVTFSMGVGSGTLPENQVIKHGEKVDKTKVTDPVDIAGFAFVGWTANGAAYNFDAEVVANLTITAKWTVLATAVLETPAAGDFRINGGTAGARSIEIDRRNQAGQYGSAEGAFLFGAEPGDFPNIPGMKEMRVYVYASTATANAATKAAPGGLASFTVYQSTFTAEGGITAANTEEYSTPGNYYMTADMVGTFLGQLLGTDYNAAGPYFFRVQFMAAGNADFNSDLGPTTAAWPG